MSENCEATISVIMQEIENIEVKLNTLREEMFILRDKLINFSIPECPQIKPEKNLVAKEPIQNSDFTHILKKIVSKISDTTTELILIRERLEL